MIRIRTKLLAFFLVVVVLVNAVAFFLYVNGQRSIEQYNYILQRLYLLNEVSQRTDAVLQSLHVYLSEQTPKHYREHLKTRQALKAVQEKLDSWSTNRVQAVRVENYRNMITSFLEESGIALDAMRRQQIREYPEHVAEAEQIRRFIKEMTLELINGDLDRFENFYKIIQKKSEYSERMGFAIFIATLLLCTLFTLLFSRGITKPIAQLSRAAREISDGQLDGAPVRVQTNDEMRFLARTFNDMRENIRRLIREIEEKSELDRLLQEMELKSLQSQIHPHFLFNVLNTISRTAYLEEAEKTNELIHATASLLRYNLGDLKKPATLEKELEGIRHYFFLQKARFGERVSFSVEADESVLSIDLPPLTLQPIVENAFIHGIESYEEGAEIMVRARSTPDGGRVEVIDNGAGMDAATVSRLMSDVEEEPQVHRGHSTGLGVKNVKRRLELFFGQSDLLFIHSEPGKGTCVTLLLPVDKKREEVEE